MRLPVATGQDSKASPAVRSFATKRREVDVVRLTFWASP